MTLPSNMSLHKIPKPQCTLGGLFQLPEYYESNNYVRTGQTIVLMPTEEYFDLFPNDPTNTAIWTHHGIKPYLFLIDRLE